MYYYNVAIVLLILALLMSFLSSIDFTGKNTLSPTKVSVPVLFGVGLDAGMFVLVKVRC